MAILSYKGHQFPAPILEDTQHELTALIPRLSTIQSGYSLEPLTQSLGLVARLNLVAGIFSLMGLFHGFAIQQFLIFLQLV